jgi:hypothetical protein
MLPWQRRRDALGRGLWNGRVPPGFCRGGEMNLQIKPVFIGNIAVVVVVGSSLERVKKKGKTRKTNEFDDKNKQTKQTTTKANGARERCESERHKVSCKNRYTRKRSVRRITRRTLP